jgi:hypothetical protein
MADETGKLKILYWNANSIQRDIFEFYDYIINTGLYNNRILYLTHFLVTFGIEWTG